MKTEATNTFTPPLGTFIFIWKPKTKLTHQHLLHPSQKIVYQ